MITIPADGIRISLLHQVVLSIIFTINGLKNDHYIPLTFSDKEILRMSMRLEA
jgi:hypothetical protein